MVSDLATAGAPPTRTKGPGALESLVEVMLRVDEWVSEPGGVNPVTWSAISPEVWCTHRAAGPQSTDSVACVRLNRRMRNALIMGSYNTTCKELCATGGEGFLPRTSMAILKRVRETSQGDD